MKKNKNAVIEAGVVVEVADSQAIIDGVISQLPSVTGAKDELTSIMEKESDHKVAKAIVSNFDAMDVGMSAVEQLELMISSVTDKDRVSLAKQKLELVNRYEAWKLEVTELRDEVNKSFSVLDEVIAGLRAVRGVNVKSGSTGTKQRQPCIVTLASDESTIIGEYPSVGNAVDNLIDKSERSQRFLKDGEGRSAPFAYDSEGNKIPLLDKEGNPTYYSTNTKTGISTLESKGYVVTKVPIRAGI